jgi:hypothetical protein
MATDHTYDPDENSAVLTEEELAELLLRNAMIREETAANRAFQIDSTDAALHKEPRLQNLIRRAALARNV